LPEKHNKILSSKNWAPHTHQALNAVISSYGNQSSSFDPAAPPYVVFDFDNTSAIMDIEDTLMLYMLLHLDYRLTPDQFPCDFDGWPRECRRNSGHAPR
jgi:hypothetical protein